MSQYTFALIMYLPPLLFFLGYKIFTFYVPLQKEKKKLKEFLKNEKEQKAVVQKVVWKSLSHQYDKFFNVWPDYLDVKPHPPFRSKYFYEEWFNSLDVDFIYSFTHSEEFLDKMGKLEIKVLKNEVESISKENFLKLCYYAAYPEKIQYLYHAGYKKYFFHISAVKRQGLEFLSSRYLNALTKTILYSPSLEHYLDSYEFNKFLDKK